MRRLRKLPKLYIIISKIFEEEKFGFNFPSARHIVFTF